MTSRWQRRNEEEKKAMHEKKLAQEEEAKKRKDDPFGMFDKDRYMEIYKGGNIPMTCTDCKCFQHSSVYEVREEDVFLIGDKANILIGRCVECGKELKRMFPALSDTNELPVFLMLLQNLNVEGRLIDWRTKT